MLNNMILLSANAPLDTKGLGYVWELFGINLDTIIFSLINLLVILLAFRFFLYKPVMNMLEKRKDAIAAELDAATKAKEKAAAAEKEYMAMLAASKAKANEIISSANARAREQEDEIIAEAKATAAGIRQKADEDIGRERKRAVNEIKNQITEIVIMAAGAVAEKEIDEQTNAKLIESFIAKADA